MRVVEVARNDDVSHGFLGDRWLGFLPKDQATSLTPRRTLSRQPPESTSTIRALYDHMKGSIGKHWRTLRLQIGRVSFRLLPSLRPSATFVCTTHRSLALVSGPQASVSR